MLLRQLFISFVVIALIALYIIIPVSHRVLVTQPHHSSSSSSSTSSRHQNQINAKNKIQKQQEREQELLSSSSSKSTGDYEDEDGHHHKVAGGDSVSSRSKPTKFPKVIPEQMEPTNAFRHAEFKNPYFPLVDDHDFLNKHQNQLLNRFVVGANHSDEKDENNNNHSPQLRKCTMLKYTQGKWVRRDQPPRPLYPALGEILGCCERGFQKELKQQAASQNHDHHNIDGDNNNNKNNNNNQHHQQHLREELYYEWIPNECDLIPWSEELFCKALRGRDIMFAGDSLNDHWHASLYYLLGGKKDIYKYEGTIGGKKRCKGHPICGKYYKKPLKLHHLTNQYLEEKSLRNRNYKWWKVIRKYPILVLNAGSWMRDVFDERVAIPDEKWRSLMEKTLGLVRREEFNGTIIWRTTYSGHPYCWNYTKPLDRPLSKDEYPDVHPYNKYRWETIPQRNKFTTNLWTKAGAHILDVERVTNLMPLGHLGKNHPKFEAKNATDCLHYCSPGPVYDTWSQLLMNLLLGNFE